MTIVVTGGGSGGHITPILAVAAELKKLEPNARIVYIGQQGDSLSDIPAQHASIDEVYTVRAGKFRRYHKIGWRPLFYIKTELLNIRDALRVIWGLGQSYRLLRKLKPDVIFTRGGYVAVPVALAGHMRGVPYITHDSDSTPSLANRLIARWARLHAVALPEELYPYPRAKTVMTGVPVSHEYQKVTPKLMQSYRVDLGLQDYDKVVCVTGGGNGARHLNEFVIAVAPALLKKYPKLAIVHFSGRVLEAEAAARYDEVLDTNIRERVVVHGFVTDFYRYCGAADVVIARGGATNLAEFARQAKPCIVVPSAQLLWNVKNAEALAAKGAVVTLSEAELTAHPEHLEEQLSALLDDEQARAKLGGQLASFARPDAAHRLAEILLEQVKPSKTTT